MSSDEDVDGSDRAEVRAFLDRRDESAFDVLYHRHTAKLYGLALRLSGGDEAVASEVVQEAWVRAIEKLGGFRWESSLSTWLCGFVVNGWRELRRRRGREIDWDATLDRTIAAPELAPSTRIDVSRAVDSLPPGYRSVLVLFGIHGHSHAEISELLGISVGTSKSQLSRARSALRRTLGARTRSPS